MRETEFPVIEQRTLVIDEYDEAKVNGLIKEGWCVRSMEAFASGTVAISRPRMLILMEREKLQAP